MNSTIEQNLPSPPAIAAEERFVTIDGARMRYLQAGSGPALILLHGLMGDSFSWRFRSQRWRAAQPVCAGPVRHGLLRIRPRNLIAAARDGRSAFQVSGCRWRLFLRFARDLARWSNRHDGSLDARHSPRSSPAKINAGCARQPMVFARQSCALYRQSARLHSLLRTIN